MQFPSKRKKKNSDVRKKLKKRWRNSRKQKLRRKRKQRLRRTLTKITVLPAIKIILPAAIRITVPPVQGIKTILPALLIRATMRQRDLPLPALHRNLSATLMYMAGQALPTVRIAPVLYSQCTVTSEFPCRELPAPRLEPEAASASAMWSLAIWFSMPATAR